MKLAGIYCIETNDGGLYYGSAKDLRRRMYRHIYDLSKGMHSNKRLQAVYDKYGLTYLHIYVVEAVNNVALLQTREQHWLDFAFKTLDISHRYNMLDNVKMPPTRKGPHSEETKHKIRQALKGRKPAESTIEAVRKSNSTRVLSARQLAALSHRR